MSAASSLRANYEEKKTYYTLIVIKLQNIGKNVLYVLLFGFVCVIFSLFNFECVRRSYVACSCCDDYLILTSLCACFISYSPSFMLHLNFFILLCGCIPYKKK